MLSADHSTGHWRQFSMFSVRVWVNLAHVWHQIHNSASPPVCHTAMESATQPVCHTASLPHRQFATPPVCHTASLPHRQSATPPVCYISLPHQPATSACHISLPHQPRYCRYITARSNAAPLQRVTIVLP